jgi:hypothetical protein
MFGVPMKWLLLISVVIFIFDFDRLGPSFDVLYPIGFIIFWRLITYLSLTIKLFMKTLSKGISSGLETCNFIEELLLETEFWSSVMIMLV